MTTKPTHFNLQFVFELGGEIDEKKVLEQVSKKSKWKGGVGIILAVLLLTSSVFFWFGLVQPTIQEHLRVTANKQLNQKLIDYQNAINSTSGVIDTFANYISQYTNQDCAIDVGYENAKQMAAINALPNQLNVNSNDTRTAKYGPLYWKQIETIKQTTYISLLGTGSKIINIASEYTEVDGFATYLKSLRPLCAKITSLQVSKTAITQSFCSDITTSFTAWKKPSTSWLTKTWELTNTFVKNCDEAKTSYSTLLTAFVNYYSDIDASLPDSVGQKDMLKNNLQTVQQTVLTGEHQLKQLGGDTSTWRKWWYLFNL